jgi:hypothetical protein
MSRGGGYTPPPDTSYDRQVQQQEYEAKQRAEQQARADAERAQQTADFNAAIEAALNNATQRATGTLQSRGLDPNQFSSVINQGLQTQRMLVPQRDPNPGQYFTDDLIDSILNREQGNRRINYTNQVSSMFTPGDSMTRFADTADDSYITDILNTQRSAAQRSVDMARSRGNLNNTGYQAALTALDDMYKSGLSEAQSIGGGVLSGYRGQLDSVANDARTAANNYSLGTSFDPTTYKSRYDTLAGDLTGRLEGDLRSALGDQEFFDLGTIITRGGNTQGAVNPKMGLADAIAERERVRNANRGTGTGDAGTF